MKVLFLEICVEKNIIKSEILLHLFYILQFFLIKYPKFTNLCIDPYLTIPL